MADKKRRGRAYLNDFERDLTGKYRYTGSHYRYTGDLPRRRMLTWMWGLSAGALVLLLAAGMMDGPGLGRCFYVLIPYAAAFVAAVSVLYTVGRLSAGGDPLREYVLEQTARRLPVRGGVTIGLSALTAVCGAVYLVLNGPTWSRAAFVLLCAGAAAAQIAQYRLLAQMDWQREDGQPPREETDGTQPGPEKQNDPH